MTDCCDDCCAGLADRTPVELTNRPGLSAVGYRTGTWASFRASMHAGLSRAPEPLARLRTRADDDVAIALIDAWATAADVLTFYTERLAHEHYLRTATERRSVADLVALLGYRLGPGVAAQTWLAITLETAPGAPAAALIPARTRVATLPGPGELPQTFETIQDLAAVGAWNRPQPRATAPRTPRSDDTSVLLAGLATGLNRGDRLLFVAADRSKDQPTTRWATARVTDVAPDPVTGRTAVTFAPKLTGLALVDKVGVSVHVLRGQAALFGFNAADPRMFESSVQGQLQDSLNEGRTEWKFDAITGGRVHLDGLYEGAQPGSWAVLTAGATAELGKVEKVDETAVSRYGLSGRVTQLTLDIGATAFGGTATRTTLVSFRSVELPLADVAITEPLTGEAIVLAVPLPPQPADRRVLVRGKRARAARPGQSVELTVRSIEPIADQPGTFRWTLGPDDSGADVDVVGPAGSVEYCPARGTDPVVGEIGTVAGSLGTEPVAELALLAPLGTVYDRLGATPIELFGNVADATHGESVRDVVLGSADAGRAFQRFPLRRAPITFVPAPTPSGGASTLEVRVNDVLWRQVATLFGAGPRDRVYVTETADDGTSTVVFGDGSTGAPTPSGTDNVVARYRFGTGLVGAARADQVTLPTTRPLGLKAVTNPLPAGGAADPQAMADARANAPRSVLTLGRVVSLPDYADFAAGWAGIGRATATWTWDGARRGVLITVAAADGAPIPPGSPLLIALRAGLLAAGDERVPLVVADFRPAAFAVAARLRVSAEHDPPRVRDAVAAALTTGYAFAARDFGQGVPLSEVAHLIHRVAGVEAVRIDRLHRIGDPVARGGFLPAASPPPGAPPDAPAAELLTLDRSGPDLEVGW